MFVSKSLVVLAMMSSIGNTGNYNCNDRWFFKLLSARSLLAGISFKAISGGSDDNDIDNEDDRSFL